MDEKTVNIIWNGFGSYIAKQLRNGKGVFVPKFGQFTFTATHVDLAGTTNPQQRDVQHRTPVFIVGKDFVSAVTLRTGIIGENGQIRPYDIKGANGIIPKVKINYSEVALLCQESKDNSRDGCEQIFRFLSDKCRKGESNISYNIPFIGTFLIRNGIAGIKFSEQLEEETRGMTAKSHLVNKLFANSVNRLNMDVHDLNQQKSNPMFGMGGAMKVTNDAEYWLKSNMNISVQEIMSRRFEGSVNGEKKLNRYGSMRPEDLKKKSWQLQNSGGQLTELNKQIFDNISNQQSRQSQKSRRPMSAVTTNSRMTSLPHMESYKIQQAVQDIYRVRAQVLDSLRNCKAISLRDQCTSTQIQQVLKKCNVFMDVVLIKCVLRDLGYNYNGPACSFYELIQNIKTRLFGKENDESQRTSQVKYSTERKMPLPRVEHTISLIKDVLYSQQQSLYQLYSQAKLGNTIDMQGFINLIMRSESNMFVEDDLRIVFKQCTGGKDTMSYQEFEKHFQWDVPQAGGQFEVYAIRCLREWMFKNGYSSETAFEYFTRLVNKQLDRVISRGEFHKIINAIPDLQQHFSAPQIDVFFQIIDQRRDNIIDPEEWQSKIYEDVSNPLQLLREVVTNNKLTPEDLLFKMHLRIWDDPLDYPKLQSAIRKLDGTISDSQIRHLAKVLKNQDNKVDVPTLLRNLCGQDYETVDFSNKLFKALYNFVNDGGLGERFKQLLEDADSINDGRVEPQGLKLAIRKIVGEGKHGQEHNILTDDNIDRFIRFLEKDKSGKISYMLFLEKMEGISNRDHNPFKSVVQRLKYFFESNKQTIQQIIKRLQQKSQDYSQEGVPVHVFADFLKQKIDKKRSMSDLHQYAYKMDIDKDGYISVIDLQTCIGNLESSTFFQNNGEILSKTQFSQSSASAFSLLKQQAFNNQPMPEERAIEVATQFRQALINQKIAYREAFNRFDENKDGLLSFHEFSQGIDKVIQFSQPIKEKLFALMDKNNIGLVDYPNFLDIVQLSTARRLKTPACQDSFDWENNVIEQIKQWIRKEGITVEEVMKIFDYDFDGKVSKDDLKNTLIQVLKINEEDIWQTRLDRLFRLLDFYKRGALQLSDMQRLVSNENPYSTVGGQRTMTPSSESFRRSMGGGLAAIKTTDWKLGAIQQIGLVISKQFDSLKESFDQATQYQLQMTYEQFKSFVEQTHALKGFNMTNVLIQQLFAELDPHKKGYLTEQDWKNAFQAFNVDDQLMIELKNLINVSFQDWQSAFEFFLTQDPREQAKSVREDMFKNGVMSLSSNRFSSAELDKLWSALARANLALDKHIFRVHFDQGVYSGTARVSKPASAQQKTRHIFTQSAYKGKASGRTTIYSQSTSSTQWEDNILEKLRSLLLTSNKNLEQIFKEMDSDGNKTISQVEFRNAIRKLNLGLTSREIDKILAKIDTNQDQKIDWSEFCAKFKRSDIEQRMEERAKDKMGKIKELMVLHMTSPNDAFKMFDKCKNGCLSYSDFSQMLTSLYQLANNPPPPYPVIKDLFDCIDVRRDGVIDQHEWQQTFGRVVEGEKKLTIKGTPYSKWEMSSEEYQKVGKALCRNRKIIEASIRQMDESKKGRNFNEMKLGLEMIIRDLKLNDDKLKIVLQPAEIQGSTAAGDTLYDYFQLLEIYKFRYA